MNEIFKELRKYNFAHRGLYNNTTVPENSMPAFKYAIEGGFAFEFDVHLTKDGKLVVVHDSSLKRVCNLDKIVEEMTFDEVTRMCLMGSMYTIPSFEEVLDLNNGRVPMLIELKVYKGNHKKLADKVMEKLKGYKGLYVLESFFPACVSYIGKNYEGVVVGQLAGDIRNELNPIANFLLKTLYVNLYSLPDFVAYQYKDRNNFFFKNYKGPKFVWTIKTNNEYLVCKKNGFIPIFEKFIPKEN